MTGHTHTIDDCSPLIEYWPEGSWSQMGDGRDAKSTSGSFTCTESIGATATFSFNGTSVTIYGAPLVDYGNYSITIDGTTQPGEALTHSWEKPLVPLVNITSLQQDFHTIILMNTGYARLDIDKIVWTSDFGPSHDGNKHLADDMLDDFEYFPEEAWWSESNLSDFKMSTGHMTSTSQASVTYTFSVSDIVSIYGTTGPQNSPYTAQLDLMPKRTFQAKKTLYKSQSLLFYADHLGPGNHTLTLTNEADSMLQIDYAMLHQLISFPPLPAPAGGGSPKDDPNQETSLGGAQVAAITTGVAILIVLMILLYLLARRNRSLWNRLQRGYMVQSQFDSSSSSLESGSYTATSSRSSRSGNEALMLVSHQKPEHSRDMSETRPLVNRPLSLVTRMTSSASTLVAEGGSNVGSPRQHRTKGLHRTEDISASMIRSPLSPGSGQLPHPFIGRQSIVELSEAHPELDVRVIGPQSHHINEIPPMPARSLAVSGRPSPGLAYWDHKQVDIPTHRNRSLSPVPELSATGGETQLLIDPEQGAPSSVSTRYLSLAGRTPRHVHGSRVHEHYFLFKEKR